MFSYAAERQMFTVIADYSGCMIATIRAHEFHLFLSLELLFHYNNINILYISFGKFNIYQIFLNVRKK